MSAQLSPTALSALRPTAEAPARLATEGLASPGAVAGQFAALLATMRDGMAAATPAASQTAGQAGGAALSSQTAAGEGEHRVASAAVSLLMQDLNESAAANTAASADQALTPSARRRQGPADVSEQVVEGTVSRGAPISAPWMATLMAAATQNAA